MGTESMNDKSHHDPLLDIQSSILDGLRQFSFPAEFRIAAPGLPLDALEAVETDPQPQPADSPTSPEPPADDGTLTIKLITEFATCLWYLKTKFFKRDWDDRQTDDDDPRVRRALSRLDKSIETLSNCGVEIHDPTNKRYPTGGEGMMRPIQFLPTAGITFELVTETVAPIVYCNERLIQRGEVFVAVPKEDADKATPVHEPDTASSGQAGSVTESSDVTDSTDVGHVVSNESDTTPDAIEGTTGAAELSTDGDAEDHKEDDVAGTVAAESSDEGDKAVTGEESEPLGDEQTEQDEETDESKRDSTTN